MNVRGSRLIGHRVGRAGVKALVVPGVVAALVAVPVGFAGPASAEQPFLVHYSDHDEQLIGQDDCVPFPVRFTHDGTGTFRGLQHGGAEFYGSDNFNDVNVFTNLENGKTFTLRAHGVDKDLRVTDDGSGVWTIEAFESGSFSYRDADGRLVVHDAGTFPYTLVIDTLGTLDPEDDEVLSVTPGDPHGLNMSAGRDLCDDLAQYLG